MRTTFHALPSIEFEIARARSVKDISSGTLSRKCYHIQSVSITARIPPDTRQPIIFLLILGLRMLGRHLRFTFSLTEPGHACCRRERTIARARCLSARSNSSELLDGRICANAGRFESLRKRSNVSGDIDLAVLLGEEVGSMSDRVDVGDLSPEPCCSPCAWEECCALRLAFRVCTAAVRLPATTESP